VTGIQFSFILSLISVIFLLNVTDKNRRNAIRGVCTLRQHSSGTDDECQNVDSPYVSDVFLSTDTYQSFISTLTYLQTRLCFSLKPAENKIDFLAFYSVYCIKRCTRVPKIYSLG